MRHRLRLPLPVACLLAVLACASESSLQQAQAAEAPRDEDQKTLYAIGLGIAQQLGGFALSAEELALVQEGLSDGILGREPKVNIQEYGPKIQAYAQRRTQERAAAQKEAARGFLVEQAALPGARNTASGLVLFELTPGTGDRPTATDRIRVHYHGTLRDGSVFDSSVDRGTPVEFALNQVIGCWQETLPKMREGGKSRVVCPSDTAYGDQGRPGIPPGAALVFEIELLEILGPAAATPDS